jgi:hypothetical protein
MSKQPTYSPVSELQPQVRECTMCFRQIPVAQSGGLVPHSVSPLVYVPCSGGRKP